METLNVHEAKAQFSSLLERVEKGETVRVARRNKVIAELRPVPQQKPVGPRPMGLMRGQVTLTAAFFEPLPEDMLKAMLGED